MVLSYRRFMRSPGAQGIVSDNERDDRSFRAGILTLSRSIIDCVIDACIWEESARIGRQFFAFACHKRRQLKQEISF